MLALAAPAVAHAERLKVCAFSFNTPHEVEAFRTRLPDEDFELVDLSPPPFIERAASGQTTTTAPPPRDAAWLAQACRTDLRCDVVVIAAEFAGRFFGAYGTSMGLHDMEEASCDPACEGLFHAPREVFLLGCNTLATKDPDRRTPAEYLAVLMEHGFERSSAERVVALRYGPLGQSFRETLRMIFKGVPRVYGFGSVAPAGDHSAKLLEKYFRAKGSYRGYLQRTGRSTRRNRELFAAYGRTDLVQVAGLAPGERAASDREEICSLYDEGESVAERLRTVRRLLERKDFLAFLPSVEVFVSRHPAERMTEEELRLFEEVRAQERARDEVLALVRGLDVSALQMELAHLALNLRWMTRDEFRRLAVDGAKDLLTQPLTAEVVDVMCEIAKHEPLGGEIEPGALPATLFATGMGIRFVDCLAPNDPEVSGRLAGALAHDDVFVRMWASYALSRRLPLDGDVLREVAVRLDDPSPEVRDRLRWILGAHEIVPERVLRAVVAHDPAFAREIRGDGRAKPGFARTVRP